MGVSRKQLDRGIPTMEFNQTFDRLMAHPGRELIASWEKTRGNKKRLRLC
jgi:hypothetical protein